jgi:uncharacterized protein YdeI (YjbR/CyaY-like superfamily)
VGKAAKHARKKSSASPAARPLACAGAEDWSAWLAKNHAASEGIWLLIAKKGSGRASVTYAEAVDGALAWGWIDSQKQAHDDTAWLQRFTPRKPKSPWSKINRDKANALVRAGRMEAPGLAEIERAKRDGRWDAAYDSARGSKVPPDLAASLARNERAAAFFATLDAANRYAILWRLQTAKKPETRARRLAKFVAMLARRERLHELPKTDRRRK